MNDLDDIHGAIDDEIYARGKVLTPTDGVRRAIARRRLLHRSAVAGSAALVAAAAVAAVVLLPRHLNTEPPTAGVDTSSTSATSSTTTPPSTPFSATAPNASVDVPQPSTSTADATGNALPTGGLDGLLVGVQWHNDSGALVVLDPQTGAVVHTYTSDVQGAGIDVLRHGTKAYFVATVNDQQCATHWSGVDLVTGDPTAAPAFLSSRAIQNAAISDTGAILAVTCDGSQILASDGTNVRDVTTAQTGRHFHDVAWHGTDIAYDVIVDGAHSQLVTDDDPLGIDPRFSMGHTVTMPVGCVPNGLTFAAAELVVAANCTDGTTSFSTVLRNAAGTLLMRKDVRPRLKEGAISDVAAMPNGDIYYVVNYEGVESDVYRLTEGTDPTLATTNLFHIAAAS